MNETMKNNEPLFPTWVKHKSKWWISWIFIAVFILLWIVLTESGIIPTFYLPSPTEVTKAAMDLRTDIFFHIIYTTGTLVISYALGILGGVGLGIAMSYYPTLYSMLEKTIEAWRPVPPVALIPFFLLWFKFSLLGRVLLISLGVAMIVVIATLEAIQSTNPIHIRAALIFGANKSKLYSTIVLPAMIPKLRAGLRIALAIGMGLEIVSEFLGAQTGLGYIINVSKVTFSTHTILLAVILLGVISAILDLGLRFLLKKLSPWSKGIESTFG